MNNNNNNISQLPKNIKQIGNIEQNQKIYIEDYVFTYLQNYSKEGGLSDRIAILVGEVLNVDGESIIFINGAIKGKYTQQINGIYTFTKECFKYIEEQLDKYFKNSVVVGWYYSQPECSDYINQAYENYQKELFKDNAKIFLLGDHIENIYIFHRYNRVRDKLEALEGYIIYYEKNEQMNEYMLANKLLNEKEEQERFKIKDEMLTSYTRGDKRNKKRVKKNRIKINFIGSLSAVCAVSVIISFMMISSLMQSENRITELEKRLVNLDESYKYVLSQIKNDNVQSVFAVDTDSKIEDEFAKEEEIDNKLEEEDIAKEEEKEDKLEEDIAKEEEKEDKLEEDNDIAKEKGIEDKLEEDNDIAKEKGIEDKLEEDNDIAKEEEKEDKLEEDNDIAKEEEKEDKLEEVDLDKLEEESLKSYRIKQGDTLESISNKFYGDRTRVEDIMDLNGLDNPNKIYIDMLLKLPN